jgi:Transglycosylase SLT domain
MKHLHTILLLSGLLLVSPVVYATISITPNTKFTNNQNISNHNLVLESTNGKKVFSLSSTISTYPSITITENKNKNQQESSISNQQLSTNYNEISSTSFISQSSTSSEERGQNLKLENLPISDKKINISSFSSINSQSSNQSTSKSSSKSETTSSSKVSSSSITQKAISKVPIPESKINKIIVEEGSVGETKIQNVEPQLSESQSSTKPLTYNELIDYYCNKYKCNTSQLKRVMMCESTNNPKARNGIHIGLFQFNPNTFNAYAKKAGLPSNSDIWDANNQINVASWMFANGQAHQWSCK